MRKTRKDFLYCYAFKEKTKPYFHALIMNKMSAAFRIKRLVGLKGHLRKPSLYDEGPYMFLKFKCDRCDGLVISSKTLLKYFYMKVLSKT